MVHLGIVSEFLSLGILILNQLAHVYFHTLKKATQLGDDPVVLSLKDEGPCPSVSCQEQHCPVWQLPAMWSCEALAVCLV